MSLTRRSIVLLTALLGVGAIAPSAHAQLGGLIKKKVDKAVEKKAAEANPTPPTFDDNVLELTPERIDGIIKASLAAQRFNESPDGPPHFAPLRDEAAGKVDAHNAKFGTQLIEYNNRVSTYENCVSSALQELRSAKRSAMMSQKPPSPAWLKIVTEFAQASAAAQQRGDTAELSRLQKKFQDQFDPTPAEIAAAETKCGGVPGMPAYVKEYKALEAQLADIDAAMGRAQQRLDQIKQQESALTIRQYSIALERLCAYVAHAEKKEALQGFSSLELHALKEKHADAVKACAKGWN